MPLYFFNSCGKMNSLQKVTILAIFKCTAVLMCIDITVQADGLQNTSQLMK